MSANTAPNAPTGLGHFRADGVTTIAVGGTTPDSTTVFRATISDPNDDPVKLQIELRRSAEFGGTFTGTATQETSLVPSGTTVQLSASGLINDTYHWQARAVDSLGLPGTWTPFGSNAESAADFTVSVPPTVSIIATSPIATETGSKTGTFVVSRTGASSAALTVFYSSVGGTAAPGFDYVALPGSAIIPAGASSVAIPVTLIADSLFERNETIVVTLIGNAAYVVGTPSSATVTMVSDDFTEPTLSPQATPIKAMHFTELRNAIDDARTRHGLAAFGWTNAPLVPGSTPVKALHLAELRTALSQAYQQVGKPLPNYAEAVVAGGTIRASHLTELRTLVRNLE